MEEQRAAALARRWRSSEGRRWVEEEVLGAAWGGGRAWGFSLEDELHCCSQK
jgi:hypothetical protein